MSEDACGWLWALAVCSCLMFIGGCFFGTSVGKQLTQNEAILHGKGHLVLTNGLEREATFQWKP